MSDPIRDRLPTRADVSDEWGEVLVYRGGTWLAVCCVSVKQGEWWKPIDQTPPPEDPVSKRRTHRRVCGGEAIHYIEVLPGDPKDLDAFIKDAMRLANDFATNYDHCEDAHKHANGACRVCNAEAFLARHGEGGEMRSNEKTPWQSLARMSDKKPWWYPVRVGPELAKRLRKDYDLPESMSDEAVLEEYGYHGKYADTWDHLRDAREQFEALADAFLELEARHDEGGEA